MTEGRDFKLSSEETTSLYVMCANSDPNTRACITPMNEMPVDELDQILDITIKKDRTAKIVTFLISLLNYTSSSQQNIGFVSVSSSGKSYIPMEILRHFPEEDVRLIQHQTPKAFYHSEGVIVEDKGGINYGKPLKSRNEYVRNNLAIWDGKNPQDTTSNWRELRRAENNRLKDIWEKTPKGILVDLSQKILFFLDMPNWHLMEELKPMLSHDALVTRSSITDKSRSGAIATKTVFLKGFPTVIFATVKTDMDEQVRNRMFLLSAGIDQAKLQAGIKHYLHTESADTDHLAVISQHEERNLLIERVKGIKDSKIDRILLHDSDLDVVEEWFNNRNSRLIPRHQRDIKHVLALIKSHAILNHTNRESNDECLIPNKDDIKAGIALYEEIAISNELGIEPELYSFWIEVLEPRLRVVSGDGITRSDFRKLWFEYAGSQLSDHTLKRKIELLETVNFIEQMKEGREIRIYARGYGVENAHTEQKESKPQKESKGNTKGVKDLPSKKENEKLPRDTPKTFKLWLSKLSKSGERGFTESEIKKAHGKNYDRLFLKYGENGFIEQRGKSQMWWISNKGKKILSDSVGKKKVKK